jgi:membrane associated rhomboid family serine protease
MTLSIDQDFSPRVKVRRRRSVLRLRQPEAAYAPAAVVLLYAAGLIGMLFAMTGLAGAEATSAGMLAGPAMVATALTAFILGARLRRFKERDQMALVLRVTSIWCVFGAAWPLLQIVPAMAYGDVANAPQFLETLRSMTLDAVAGGVAGAVGGICGGAASVALCIEKVR